MSCHISAGSARPFSAAWGGIYWIARALLSRQTLMLLPLVPAEQFTLGVFRYSQQGCLGSRQRPAAGAALVFVGSDNGILLIYCKKFFRQFRRPACVLLWVCTDTFSCYTTFSAHLMSVLVSISHLCASDSSTHPAQHNPGAHLLTCVLACAG